MSVETKFRRLGTGNAPGQEGRQQASSLDKVLRGDPLPGRAVDFSHGDVDAFAPPLGSFEVFAQGVALGGRQAYTEYRGDITIREQVAERTCQLYRRAG